MNLKGCFSLSPKFCTFALKYKTTPPMKIELKRIDDNFLMQAQNEQGHQVLLDGSKAIGGGESSFRPMQMLLVGLGGCSAIDVISILKKQRQEPFELSITIEGERQNIGDYSLFRDIVLHFHLTGKVDAQKAQRAIELSLEKYCSVAKTLEPTANIRYELHLHP
jgi:putative redox protein